ncbi:hypothetical protein CC1G_15378 [Coprinopsis cinerea okayama7|uniref:Uncharacterized protein n=1 Tax=Coprinopsis cinerea (strain Okayama-7 / 130 / ATCC MYA-4618 / FGSC 9003) TaxID=240176 RepID=D6RQK9_COPC7|nr:hypothetical protein CC1G_15378 [Coprinopsis cinerea okayama7\|eukprot:XP_002910100.1 hypothetical protein CC1G_15378 [Coprinopsis cinerea okayama7\
MKLPVSLQKKNESDVQAYDLSRKQISAQYAALEKFEGGRRTEAMTLVYDSTPER